MKTNDVELIYKRFSTLIPLLRKEKIPHVELINTYRIGPHSKGDDFRDISEISGLGTNIENWEQDSTGTESFTPGVSWGDYDNDGWIDIFITSDFNLVFWIIFWDYN